MKKTLIIGPAVLDLAAYVDHLSKSDEEISPRRTVQRIGGAGFSAACIFEMLGLPYELIAPVGTGVYGDWVRQEAEQHQIRLKIQPEEVSGCTYTLIDPQGNRGMMAVPGAESVFRADDLKEIDPDEIGNVLVSAELLEGEGREELLETLQAYSGRIFLELGGRGVLLDETARSALYALHPTLYLTEEEAGILTQNQEYADLLDAVRSISAETQASVVVLLQDGGGLEVDGRQGISTSAEMHEITDASGVEECHAAAYLAARVCGLSPRQSLQMAGRMAAEVASSEQMVLPSSEGERWRQALAAMILEKKVN